MEDNISRRNIFNNWNSTKLALSSPIELKTMFNVLNANFAWHSSAPACLVILLVTFEVSNDRFGFSIKVLYSNGKNWFGLGLCFGF
jgi:uncharacterized protein with WD repeat